MNAVGKTVTSAKAKIAQAETWSKLLFSSGISLALILLVALLYGRTLAYPFNFDDLPYLVSNPLLKNPENFGRLLDFDSLRAAAGLSGGDHDLVINFILRPVCYLSFYLNHWAAGDSPAGYRLVNIVIHAANSVLVFLFVMRLLSGASRVSSLSRQSVRFIACTSAVLFAVHPLQTESVTYVIQRFTSLSTFFYLIAALLCVMSWTARSRCSLALQRILSVLFTIAGMLTKESVFTLPVMLVVLDCLFMGTPLRRALRRSWPQLLCLPIVPVLVLLTQWARNGGALSVDGALNLANPDHGGGYPVFYALSQPAIILSYLRLLFDPVGLNVDPDPPLVHSLASPRAWGPLCAIIAILAAAIWMLRRRRGDPRIRLCGTSVIWFFLGLLVTSSFVPLPDLMAEHRTYRPCIAFMICLACLADLVRTRWPGRTRTRWIIPALMVFWTVHLAALTEERNKVWSSPEMLWSDSAAKSPGKARPLSNLAINQALAGRLAEAAANLRKAVADDPGNVAIRVNLCTIQNKLHLFSEAAQTAREGLSRKPPPAVEKELCFNASFALGALGQTEECIPYLRRIIVLDPGLRDPRHGNVCRALGCFLLADGRRAEALENFRTVLAIRPNDHEVAVLVAQIETAMSKG